MLTTVVNFFTPPKFESFELTQKTKFLHITLLTMGVACILLGFQNMAGRTFLDEILFVLGVICFICVPFNKKGYYTHIAIFISILFLILITFSLIDGVGLKDAGLMA